MSLYQPGIPTGTVNLDVDYQNLQNNFSQLDTTYGVDHYKYSNQTSNNGFHNKVTTPIFVDNPVTGLPPVTTTNPILYAFEQYSALGTLQYSRGESNAVPTPLTNLYSASTPLILASAATTNVLDFTGMSFAIVNAYAFDTVQSNSTSFSKIFWTGSAFRIRNESLVAGLPFQSSGNILILKNNSGVLLSNIYWALDIVRIQ